MSSTTAADDILKFFSILFSRIQILILIEKIRLHFQCESSAK